MAASSSLRQEHLAFANCPTAGLHMTKQVELVRLARQAGHFPSMKSTIRGPYIWVLWPLLVFPASAPHCFWGFRPPILFGSHAFGVLAGCTVASSMYFGRRPQFFLGRSPRLRCACCLRKLKSFYFQPWPLIVFRAKASWPHSCIWGGCLGHFQSEVV